jgi:phage shock protein A
MGFFARLKTLLKSNINDMISEAEDPEKMLNQILVDMRDQFTQAKKEVALSIADEKRLKRQYEEQRKKADAWGKKAMLAVKAGDDALAKQALLRKSEGAQLTEEYKQQWQAQKQTADNLKEALRTLSRKIEEAKRKKNLLIAKKKRAEAQQSIQKTLSSLSDSTAFDTYARMEDKIEQMSAEAEASLELSAAMNEADALENRFSELEKQRTADAMLAELKAEMAQKETSAKGALPESSETKKDKEVDLDAELEEMKAKLREEVEVEEPA